MKFTRTENKHYQSQSDGKYYKLGDDGILRLTEEEKRKERIRNANSQSKPSSAPQAAQQAKPQAAPVQKKPKEPGAATMIGAFALGYFLMRCIIDADFRKTSSKIISKMLIVGGLLFVVVIGGLLIYVSRDEITRSMERRANFTMAQEGDFYISTRVVHNDDGIPWIAAAGTITNNTDYNWEFISFEYTFTDANGQEHQAVRAAVGNRPMEITVRNIPAGGSAEFETQPLPVNLSMDSIRASLVEYSNVSYQITDFVVTLDKNLFAPGENITATVHGNISQQMVSAGAFIAIFEAGAGTGAHRLEQHDLNGSDGIFNFTAPTAGGNYEIRFYDRLQHMSANIYSTNFIVVPEPVQSRNSNFSISLDRDIYAPGENIMVTVEGIITRGIVRAGAFIAIYEAGAGFRERQEYHNLEYSDEIRDSSAASGPTGEAEPSTQQEQESLEASEYIFNFTAPDAGGNYEIRLYYPNPRNANETVFIKMEFTVE